MTAKTQGSEASTLGWDTVFAVPIGMINKAIVDRKVSPKTLDCKPSGPSEIPNAGRLRRLAGYSGR